MNKEKYLTVAVVLVVVCLVAAIIWQYNVIKNQQAKENLLLVEMKTLKDNIVRSEARYVSKADLENLAKQNNIDLDPIRDDLDDLNAEIKGLSTLLATTSGYKGVGLPSTSTQPRDVKTETTITVPCDGSTAVCPNLDTFGYLNNEQTLKLNEPFSNGLIPWGETTFKAWEQNPWSLTVFPRNYSVVTVLGQDEDGRHYTYHKFNVTTQGKTYPVPIQHSQFVEEFPKSSFHFSPRLYLGVDVGAHVYPMPQAEVTPNIGLGLFSYGPTKVNPDFTFVQINAGFNTQSETFAIGITPLTYNVGNHIPFMNNLHIGPTISVDNEGSVSLMGGFKVGL